MQSSTKLDNLTRKALKNKSRAAKLCFRDGSMFIVDFYTTVSIPSHTLWEPDGSEYEIFSENDAIRLIQERF